MQVDEQLFERSSHVMELMPEDVARIVNGSNSDNGTERDDMVYMTMLYSPRCGMTRLTAPYFDLVATQLATAFSGVGDLSKRPLKSTEGTFAYYFVEDQMIRPYMPVKLPKVCFGWVIYYFFNLGWCKTSIIFYAS